MDFSLLQDALTIFLGIFFEAIPFILLGVIVSSVIQQFISPDTLLRFIPRRVFFASVYGSLIGFLFPVCECGNIPVARRLLLKGVPPSVAISFLLGAPVLNPIVIAATIAAFPSQPEITLARIGLSFVIAVTVGALFALAPRIFVTHTQALPAAPAECDHHHSPTESLVQHSLTEFFEMGGIMVIGGALASLTQVFIPREAILALATDPATAVLSLMLLAFVVSICSNVDSFFALAYAPLFPVPALLGFLVWGPMMDIKALIMLRTTFTVPAITLMALFSGLLTYIGTMLLYWHF